MRNTHLAQSGRSPILSLVEAANRRRLFTLALEESAFAFITVFAASILLLLLGTDLLAWPWLVAIVFAGVSYAGMRVRRRLLGRYAVAQLLDKRLRLDDSLATAWFLLKSNRQTSYALAPTQIARAEEKALAVEPAAAFPYVWRRSWSVAGALCAVVLGLFAARYLVTSSLSLKRAWLPLPASSLRELFSKARQSGERTAETVRSGARSQHPASAMRQNGRPDDLTRAATQTQAPKAGAEPQSTGSFGPQNSSEGQRKQANAGQSAGAQPAPAEASGEKAEQVRQQQNASAATAEQPHGTGERQDTASLANRMREALSGLLDRMRPSAGSKNGDGRPQPEATPASQTAGNNLQNAPVNQQARDSGEQDGIGREQNAPGQSAAQASEKSPDAASRAAGESAGHKGNDAHSGIGRQDGEKALREAEQLRAMGKLEEIIGKRSASLTGDMTVETQAGHEQLQTQYTGRVGHHADLGGQLDRNEVPVALQNYVREYMEQVRKQTNGNQ